MSTVNERVVSELSIMAAFHIQGWAPDTRGTELLSTDVDAILNLAQNLRAQAGVGLPIDREMVLETLSLNK